MNDTTSNADNAMINISISLILGMLLGIIIYRFYLFPPIVRGPNSRDIVDKIFEVNGRYYELAPVVCGCLRKKSDNIQTSS
jgi:hypothetical protein